MDRYRVEGPARCGYCYATFDSEDPPVTVIKHSQGFDYPEDRPWHERCVAEANTEQER